MPKMVLQDFCEYIRELARINKASAVTLSQGVAQMKQAKSWL